MAKKQFDETREQAWKFYDKLLRGRADGVFLPDKFVSIGFHPRGRADGVFNLLKINGVKIHLIRQH